MKEEGVQYTIAYMHWGIEYQTTPSKQQTEMAQKLCDMGVDTLIGSHPHVIQPVDLLTSSDGKHQMVCAYAIGNFLSNQRAEYMQAEMPTGETEDSFLLTLSLSSDEKGKVTLTDVTFTPMWTYRYEGQRRSRFRCPAGKRHRHPGTDYRPFRHQRRGRRICRPHPGHHRAGAWRR